MRRTIEASAGTGKTYELTTIVVAALAGARAIGTGGSGLVATPEFERLLDGGRVAPTEFLLTTFTEAATGELRARVRARLADVLRGLPDDEGHASERGALERALADVDLIPIRTIHGVCASIIAEYGFELGVPGARAELVEEADLARELAMQWWSARVRDDPHRAQVWIDAGLDAEHLTAIARESLATRGAALAEARATAGGADGADRAGGADALILDLMRFARTHVDDLLRARGAITFQDQLVTVLDGVRASERLRDAIRSRVRLCIVDEAQDTDPVQLEIFARLFDEGGDPRRLLVFVGDPKQSIYGFRGADLDAYLRVREGDALLRLGTNRRSEAAVVEAVNRLFGAERPFIRPEIEHLPVDADPKVAERHGELAARAGSPRPPAFSVEFGAPGLSPVEWCVRRLTELHARGLRIRGGPVGDRPLRWGDFAVLGRRHAQLWRLDRALRAAGIPSILLGDRSVLRSDAVDDLRALLEACAEPGRAARVRRALVSRLVAVEPARLARGDSEAIVAVWAERFAAWSEAAPRSGALGIVERALVESDRPVDARTATDALHLAELVHEATGAGARPTSMVTALDRLVEEQGDRATRPGDRRRRRIECDDGVTLQTIHNAKGLEYGLVLLPWEDAPAWSPPRGRRSVQILRVPVQRLAEVAPALAAPAGTVAGAGVVAPVPLGTTPPLLAERAREEARRTLYVAVTRARHAVAAFVEDAPGTRPPSALEELGVTRDSNEFPPEAAASALPERGAPPSAGAGAAPSIERARAGSRSARPLGRGVSLWVDTSFSRLATTHASSADSAPELLATPSAPALRDDEPAPVVTRNALAGGAVLGRVLHRVFEWGALAGARADLAALARRAIEESGLEDRLHADALAALVDRTRRADLAVVGGPPIPLGAVPPAGLAAEMNFCLPLGHASKFSPPALARAFAAAPAGSACARFAPVAATLAFGEISGFLRGTIDLLFVHGDRWWIVDYKSNDLGDRDEDYRAPSLLDAMVRDRYVLQYALYAVAVRRLLAGRGVDARGDRLGGVIYPFLRGVDPREPGRGLFFDRPADVTIDAIDALLGAPATGGTP